MLLSALTEWIRTAADDLTMVAAVSSWPELLTHGEFPVDVVLLDLDLKDSIPISLKISTLKTTGVKTVLMSTYSDPNVVREALAAGALGYLVKSEDATMIVEAIRAAAPRSSAPRSDASWRSTEAESPSRRWPTNWASRKRPRSHT